MRIFCPNLVRNEVVLERAGENDIVDEIRERKWRWIGLVDRREDGHSDKQAITFHMEGRRRVCRPKETWICIARREFESHDSTSIEW